jgi:hypothetical protein
MPEPIEYRTPLPAGYQLRYDVGDEGVRISRETPRSALLWSEACAPLILLGASVAFCVFIWRLPGRLNLPPENAKILHIVGYALFAGWMYWNGRRAWQNVGIVVEIAVAGDTLYWRKQNVWGSREYFWPLSSIKTVSVQTRLLKVFRDRGPALAAFSFLKPDERAYACMLLNGAIAHQRRSILL